jgi:hypothetical protein
MRCLQLVWQWGRLALCTMTGWLAVHGTALAEQAAKTKEGEGGSYVLPYALVILGVGLGLLLVCRSSHRRDRARPEQYDESKATPKE